MKQAILHELTLGTKVRLTPKGPIYKVVISNKSRYKAALENAKGRTIEKPQLTSVYIVSKR